MNKKENNHSPSKNQRNHTSPDFFGSSDIALRFLRWFCPPSLYEGIEGDLLEQFEEDLKPHEPSDRLPTGQAGSKRSDGYLHRRAKKRLFWNVLKFFRPEIILRNKFSIHLNPPIMIKNYLTVAYRNLTRHKLSATINIVGLSLGISACILIGVYVGDELSFDRFHGNANNTFRVLKESNSSVQHFKTSSSPVPLADAMKESIPEVEEVVRIAHKNVVVKEKDESFDAKLFYTDPSFFDVFDFPIISQGTLRPLRDSSEVVISQTAALRYFKTVDVIGKILQIREETSFHDFKVVAVVNDAPKNSTLQFDVLLQIPKDNRANWRTGWPETYVKVIHGTILQPVEDKILRLYSGQGKYEVNEISTMKIILEPLADIRFNMDTRTPYVSTNPKLVTLLMTIGCLILLLAIVTFTTITLSQATSRAKEVGVRKTMGAKKNQLVNQFYTEMVVIACCAFLLSLLITFLALPFFNSLAGKSFSISLLQQPLFWMVSISFLIITIFLSGSYPAFFMSSFHPSKIIRKEFHFVSKQQLIRALTSLQVALSFMFLISAFIIYLQASFITRKDLGFTKNYIIRIPVEMSEGLRTKMLLESELSTESSVREIAASWQKFAAKDGVGYNYFPVTSGNQEVYGNALGASPEFATLFNLTLVQGNYFSKEHRGVLVNEALVKAFGWKDPIGRNVSQMFGFDDPIVGVVKDFHYQSLHEAIQPLVIHADQHYSNIFISFAGGDISSDMKLSEKAWRKINPAVPFKFSFVDDDIQAHYEIESRWQKIILYAAALALIISCLGILGMANLTATRRTKEIGVRKVMGASTSSILVLLSKDYVKLIGLSFFVAGPVTYYILLQWLRDFAYHIDLQWWMFAVPGLIIVALILLAVGGQSLKTVLINPAETLKYE
jgi:putative ABC transport system permease protein